MISLLGEDRGALGLFNMALDESIDIVTCGDVIDVVLTTLDRASKKNPPQSPLRNHFDYLLDIDHHIFHLKPSPKKSIEKYVAQGFPQVEAKKMAVIFTTRPRYFATYNALYLNHHQQYLAKEANVCTATPESAYKCAIEYFKSIETRD